MNFNVKNNYFILGVFLCFSLTSYAQNDSTIIRRNFVGKNLSELDKITTETVENIITFFNRKKKPFGYKIGTNKHEKIIKKQTVPNDYIITKPIIRINQADFRNFEIEKNINPKLELVVTYPRITPSWLENHPFALQLIVTLQWILNNK